MKFTQSDDRTPGGPEGQPSIPGRLATALPGARPPRKRRVPASGRDPAASPVGGRLRHSARATGAVFWLAGWLLVASGLGAQDATSNHRPDTAPSKSATPAGTLEDRFHQGLIEEEGNQNLEAAVQAYREVIVGLDASRKMEATALYRLGECYRKQGKTNEAVVQYQRVVADFSEQTTLVDLSRKNLASLASPSAAPSLTGAGLPAGATTLDDEAKEIQRLQALVQNSPDLINAGNPPPLLQAASAGELAVARFLVAHGAEVNVRSATQATPLIAAAGAGQKAMVELLLEQGATINAADQGGETALMKAARSGFQAVVEVLLAHRADPNLGGRDGRTPLWWAAAGGHVEIVRALLAAGADPSAADANGLSPLMEAARAGSLAAARLLVAAKANLEAKTFDGKTALWAAVEVNRTNVAGLLLEHGAHVNAPDGNMTTPLWRAVEEGATDMTALLLEHGADVTARQGLADPRFTPRFRREHLGMMALHVAALRGHTEIVRLLLAHKADSNAKDGDGTPPLHYAVGFDHPGVAELLLAGGAAVNTFAPWTMSRPQGPYFGGPPERMRLELTALELAVRLGKVALVRPLLAKGADLNTLNADGITPLCLAVAVNNTEILQLLLGHKPDLELRAPKGVTPLQLAVGEGSVNIARLLLDAGANVNIMNRDTRETPLFDGVRRRDRAMVELLLAHKAEVNLLDASGRSPLGWLQRPPVAPPPGTFAPVGPTLPSPMPVGFLPAPGGSPPGPAAPGAGPDEAEAATVAIRALLLKAGANPELERESFIGVSRPSRGLRENWFEKAVNPSNRFTLLELIANFYAREGRLPGEGKNPAWLAFPALARVRVERLDASGRASTPLLVDAEAMLTAGDYSKDPWLQWGDVVEIPEADHRLNEPWPGFAPELVAAFEKALTRKVQILVKDQTNTLTLLPWPRGFAGGGVVPATQLVPGEVLVLGSDGRRPVSPPALEPPSFWLAEVVNQCGLLRLSSDTSRVRVRRSEPTTHQPQEFVFDLQQKPSPSFWLRNGDQIEVPEKGAEAAH